MGWRAAPDRYLKSGRSWIPRSRFQPLKDIRDALRVLDAVTSDYSLVATPGGVFTVEVRLGGRVGKAFGGPKARAISLAVARAMALDLAPEADSMARPGGGARIRDRKHGE